MAEQTMAGHPLALPQRERQRTMWQQRHLFERLQPYLYLLPVIVTLGIWIYWPLVRTVYLSFFQWNLLPTTPMIFVGWENYRRILGLPEMQQAIRNTVVYTLGIMPLSVLIPLVVALFTDNIGKRWRNLYRGLIFIPMLIAPVVVSIIWRWLLNPTVGIVNYTLTGGTFAEPVNFFRGETLAIWTIIGITGWKLVGFSTLIFSAAITNINRDYIEAASIDGANYRQIVRSIILPLLSPTVLLLVMLSVLLVSQWSFAYINVLTQGGPLGATTNVYYILYTYGFRTFAIGWSSAAAVILFITFGLLAAGLLSLINRYSFYDS